MKVIRVRDDIQAQLKAQAALEKKTQQELAEEIIAKAVSERQDKKKKK